MTPARPVSLADVSPARLTGRAGVTSYPPAHVSVLESAAAEAIARFDR